MTTNTVNGNRYIGRHKGKFNHNYKGSGIILTNAVKKYGKDKFSVDVVEWCSSEEELNMKEIFWIKHYDAVLSEHFYNLIDSQSPSMTPEIAKKISCALLEYFQTPTGITQRNKDSERKLGVPLSKQHKEAITAAWNDELHNDMSTKAIVRNANKDWYDKTYTKEWRQSVSGRFSGIPKTEEHRRKISEANTGTPHTWQDKINKNPEKIRKTAEWHTGKKRPQSTRDKQSKRRKEIIEENGGALNKGTKMHFNPETKESGQYKEGGGPSGWILGNPKSKGKKCYWDGVDKTVVKRFFLGDQPNNWILGNPKNPLLKENRK